MKTDYRCLPCFIKQAITAIEFATSDKNKQQKAIQKAFQYLLRIDLNQIPAVTATQIYRIVKKETGCPDPFKKVKDKYNKIALTLYPRLKKLYIEKSKDRLLTALLLSVAGNIIDFGFKHKFNLDETVVSSLRHKFPSGIYKELKDKIKKSKSILFLADNAGEIVFDRFILEELKGKRLIAAVKGWPVINDATLEDAKFCKLQDFAKIITTGTDDLGINPKTASKEFLNIFKSADLIISKGQANYETLHMLRKKNIFFLLQVKCFYLCELLHKEIYEPVLLRG